MLDYVYLLWARHQPHAGGPATLPDHPSNGATLHDYTTAEQTVTGNVAGDTIADRAAKHGGLRLVWSRPE